jgi:hypothetical protein
VISVKRIPFSAWNAPFGAIDEPSGNSMVVSEPVVPIEAA